MREYTEIIVEESLLPQVVRELLEMATDPNYVEVSYGATGRVVLAHTELAEAWYQKHLAEDEKRSEIPIPIPVQRDKDSPRNIPSASPDGEEQQ